MMIVAALLLISLTVASGQGPPPPPPDLTGIPDEGQRRSSVIDPPVSNVDDPFGTGNSILQNLDSSLDSSALTKIVYTPHLRATMQKYGVTEAKLREMLEQQKRTGKPASLTFMDDGIEKTITWDFAQLQSTLEDLGFTSLPNLPSIPAPSSSTSKTTTTVSRTSSSSSRVRDSAAAGLQAILGGPESQLGGLVNRADRTRTTVITESSGSRSPTSSGSRSPTITRHVEHSQRETSRITSPMGREGRLSGSVSTGIGTVGGDGVGTVLTDRSLIASDDIDPMVDLQLGNTNPPLLSNEASLQIDAMIERVNKMRDDLFKKRQSFQLTDQQYATELAKVEEEERRLREMIMQENMRARQPLVVDPISGGGSQGSPRDMADIAALQARERWERQLVELRKIQEENNRLLQQLNREARIRAESRARLDGESQRTITELSSQLLGDVARSDNTPVGQSMVAASARRDEPRRVSERTELKTATAKRAGTRQITRPGQITGGGGGIRTGTVERTILGSSTGTEQRAGVGQSRGTGQRAGLGRSRGTGQRAGLGQSTATDQRMSTSRISVDEQRMRGQNNLRQEYESLRQQLLQTEAELRAIETRLPGTTGMIRSEVRDPLPPIPEDPLLGTSPARFDSIGRPDRVRQPPGLPDYVPLRVSGTRRRARPQMAVAEILPSSGSSVAPRSIGSTRRISELTRFPSRSGDAAISGIGSDGFLDNTLPEILPATPTEPYVWDRRTRYFNEYPMPGSSLRSSGSGMVLPWYRRQRIIRTTDTDPLFTSGTQSRNYPRDMIRRRRIIF